jgi:AcrR family transcriptional regulator
MAGPASARASARTKVKSLRSRLDLNERRTQLLELGIDLFCRYEYDEISIDALAELAGVSKGLLYHYFPSKKEFYLATVKESSMRLQQLTVPDPSLSPAARLNAAIDEHLKYIEERRSSYLAMYRGGFAVAPEVGRIIEEHRSVVFRYFLEGLGVSKPSPMLRTSLRAWILMVEGASLDWLSNPTVERGDLRDLLVAAYVAMLGKTIELDPKTAQSIKR